MVRHHWMVSFAWLWFLQNASSTWNQFGETEYEERRRRLTEILRAIGKADESNIIQPPGGGRPFFV